MQVEEMEMDFFFFASFFSICKNNYVVAKKTIGRYVQ